MSFISARLVFTMTMVSRAPRTSLQFVFEPVFPSSCAVVCPSPSVVCAPPSLPFSAPTAGFTASGSGSGIVRDGSGWTTGSEDAEYWRGKPILHRKLTSANDRKKASTREGVKSGIAEAGRCEDKVGGGFFRRGRVCGYIWDAKTGCGREERRVNAHRPGAEKAGAYLSSGCGCEGQEDDDEV